jgi:hypothetical protein
LNDSGLKKMIVQSLVWDIFCETYGNAFRLLPNNENGHDGEKARQAI